MNAVQQGDAGPDGHRLLVTHLVDPLGPGGGPCTLRLVEGFIRESPRERHEVVVLGSEAGQRLAERHGLRPMGRIPLVAGRVGVGAMLLRGALGLVRSQLIGRGRSMAGTSAVASDGGCNPRRAVIAWSWRALIAAGGLRDADGGPGSLGAWLAVDPGSLWQRPLWSRPVAPAEEAIRPSNHSPSPQPARVDDRAAWWSLLGSGPAFHLGVPGVLGMRGMLAGQRWAAALDRRPRIAGPSPVVDSLARAGQGSIDPRLLRVVSPAVSVEPSGSGPSQASPDRAALRAEWRAEAGELVVALVAEPPERGDARLACYGAAIACVTGRRFRMLLHPAAHAVGRWANWARATGLMGAVTIEPRLAEPSSIARGVDVALCAGEAREPFGSLDRSDRRSAVGLLPLMELMAAGVPAIAERTPTSEALIVDRQNGLLIPLDDRVSLARRLVELHDDPAWREGLGRAGRDHVCRTASIAEFARRLRWAVFDEGSPD